MFGAIKLGLRGTSCSQRGQYRTAYCGLCKSLGTHFDTPSRIMVNHDLVLFALAIEGLRPGAAEMETCRCPLMPWSRRRILPPHGLAMKVSALVQILLADAWLQDKQADGQPWAGWIRPLLKRRRAEQLADEMGLDIEPFKNLSQSQSEIECRDHVTPAEAAEPTANLLAHLSEQIAVLVPPAAEINADLYRENLRRLGFALGQVIYLFDALTDLDADQRRGHFNPLLEGGVLASQRLEDVSTLLEQAVSRIQTAIDYLPWQRHEALMRHLFEQRLPQRASALLEQVASGLPKPAHVPQVNFQLALATGIDPAATNASAGGMASQAGGDVFEPEEDNENDCYSNGFVCRPRHILECCTEGIDCPCPCPCDCDGCSCDCPS